jgi:DNA-binding winged helix-turn-helix (wHTH) protein
VNDSPPRYRFDRFVLSPRRRSLTRDEVEVPLIPRYFDLLVLLVERRHEAVHRNDIFARVWSDVVVSDGALAQAVRVLRRALQDDPREPRFIRTISRHGYRFVFEKVVIEADTPETAVAAAPPPASSGETLFESLIVRLLADETPDDDRRDAAEGLLQYDVARVLSRLDGEHGHQRARAFLREARWTVPGGPDVPLLGEPGSVGAATVLAWDRVRQAWRLAGGRWGGAVVGAALAGALAGSLGGVVLVLLPQSTSAWPAVAVLTAIGAAAAAFGAAGIGAGLAAAEVIARSWRQVALVVGGALGGGLVAWLANALTRWTLTTLFSLEVHRVGGTLEGVVIGGAVGLGYAWATPQPGGGMAAPRGRARVVAGLRVAAVTALAAAALAFADRPLVGAAVNDIAQAARSQMTFAPLGRLLGEPDFGRATSVLFGAFEGAAFGLGLTVGLARRRRGGTRDLP